MDVHQQGMALDGSSILQANAAILAGLIILLTLLSFREEKMPSPPPFPAVQYPRDISPEKKEQNKRERFEKWANELKEYFRVYHSQQNVRNTLSVVTIGGLLPFSVSAILIILWSIDLCPNFGLGFWAKIAMIVGLAYLIIAVVLMVRAYRRIQILPAQQVGDSFLSYIKSLPFFDADMEPLDSDKDKS